MNRGVAFVTGANGFLGSHLCRFLIKKGVFVRALTREKLKTEFDSAPHFEWVRGDFNNDKALSYGAKKARWVFHCGAHVSDWGTYREIYETNVEGTEKILRATDRSQLERFVLVSTTDVYGYPGRQALENFRNPNPKWNAYAHTKALAEDRLKEFCRSQSLPFTIVRPGTIYGPESRNVILEIARALEKGQMILIGRGETKMGLAYIDNVVEGIWKAATNPQALGETFNLTDQADFTWKKFLDDLANELGFQKPRRQIPYGLAIAAGTVLEKFYRILRSTTGIKVRPLLSRQAVHIMGTDQNFPSLKAQELLGFRTGVTYEDGLRRTAQWVREVLS